MIFFCLFAVEFYLYVFQLLKGKYIFCRRVSEKFPCSFLTFFISMFANSVKPRYFREFVFRNVGFWNRSVCNLNRCICKLSQWILRQGQLIRQPRHTQSAVGHPVNPVEFPVFTSRFIISKRRFFLESLGSDHFHRDPYGLASQIQVREMDHR